MSSHVFHEIYLHINWHTKHDQPLLDAQLEPQVHACLKMRCIHTKGVYFHAVGGTEDHVHLAVSIEPQVTISALVGELKGGSSFDMNKQAGSKVLEWQRGFGVVSFGKKQLPWVLDYIARQKEHHRGGRVHERLERYDTDAEASSDGA